MFSSRVNIEAMAFETSFLSATVTAGFLPSASTRSSLFASVAPSAILTSSCLSLMSFWCGARARLSRRTPLSISLPL